jgi:hypothetical protein
MSHGVLRHAAAPQELLQVVRPAGLHAGAGEGDAAEGLDADQGAGDLAVQIEVADPEGASRPFKVCRQARVDAAGQRGFETGRVQQAILATTEFSLISILFG